MKAAASRAFVIAIALAACSDELRGPPAQDLVAAAERALSRFEASTETQALVDRASEAAWSLDARSLYEAIPDAGDADRKRGVAFEIRGDEGRRSIRHHSIRRPASLHQIFEASADVPHETEPELGRYSLLLASMPLGSGDYRLRVTSAIDSGRGDMMTLWRALPEGLRYLERGAPPEEARQRFPRTTAFAARYAKVSVSSRPETPRGAAVEISIRANRSVVAADYPNLVRYIERLSRRVQTSGGLEREDGAELASWRFRGPEEGADLSFVTTDGQLQSKAGDLVDLTSPQRLRLVQSSTAEVFGVRTSIEGMRSAVHSDPQSGGSPQIAIRADADPKIVRVEGALFGIVPVAAIDAVLPGTLEGSVRSILATVLHGRDGDGVDVLVRSRTESASEHEISSTLVADVPATRFARRALGLAAALIRADASERADMLRFARDLAACLASDLAMT